MKRKIKVAIITFLHVFNLALKAENDLLSFVSFEMLFQMNTRPLGKAFCLEDVLNRGI